MYSYKSGKVQDLKIELSGLLELSWYIEKDELKKEAYRQYCLHISQGRSKEAWKFVHPTDPLKSLTWETIESYMKKDPVVFPPILMKVAEADSFNIFEQLGMSLMRGEIKNGSPETWKTFMRNKFKWDRESIDQIADCAADKILEKIMQK